MNSLLFTGASGFLGRNILSSLKQQYDVDTIGLTLADSYTTDLSREIPDLISGYDIVLHAAGKAHSIPKTEQEKQLFFDVNYQGTVNLCSALEHYQVPKSFIFISTVAVYGLDSGEKISENTPLKGTSPYAVSKIKSERFLEEWCSIHNVKLSILRPSLIAGPNPPGNLGSMIKGLESGRYLRIGNGDARKSILMAQDIANLIPLLQNKEGTYNVCDTHDLSFQELETLIVKQLKKRSPIAIPYHYAKLIAQIGDQLGPIFPINSNKLNKITKSLTFSNEKAKKQLGWKPLSVLHNFKIR